ncbi:coiled-coil domain-containing [Cordyceps militaris]|uniref:Coiled-coil domain-containing n=1 Tax=Cordyceps militaris TaxID=73501 RepID=A0A2H4SJB2_CORMI|nr:coiled-coil domain-containing [Cordyceps militaris]
MPSSIADTSLPTTDPIQPTAEKPVPRHHKSATHSAQVQIQNRRREYLLRHPAYFDSIEHELADPVLYERLVRRHQSATERESEGRAKGYGRTLEADLVRGETKLSHLHAPSPLSSTGIDEMWEQPAADKAHGRDLWRLFLTHRFVHGRDEDFDYENVDGNEAYDDLARMEAEQKWFDDERPTRADDKAPLQGETGVQDF